MAAKKDLEGIEKAINLLTERAFISPNVPDRNLEPANVVDALDKVARGLFDIADAIRETGGRSS